MFIIHNKITLLTIFPILEKHFTKNAKDIKMVTFFIKYASIELLDQLKRIETDDTIQVQLDEGGSIDVQVSAKKIS